MLTLTPLIAVVHVARARMAAAADQRGAISAEYLIWTAALAVGVIAIAAIIINTLTNKATSINLG